MVGFRRQIIFPHRNRPFIPINKRHCILATAIIVSRAVTEGLSPDT
jgi:hypothetical protein